MSRPRPIDCLTKKQRKQFDDLAVCLKRGAAKAIRKAGQKISAKDITVDLKWK